MWFSYRGQESAGIVTSEGNNAKSFHVQKGMGMINNVFTDDSMKKLKGKGNCELHFIIIALGPVWAETRAQSVDWYSSGTLHPGQVLRGSLPLLSPVNYISL